MQWARNNATGLYDILDTHAPQSHWFLTLVTAPSSVQFLESGTFATVSSAASLTNNLPPPSASRLRNNARPVDDRNSHDASSSRRPWGFLTPGLYSPRK